MLKCVVIPAKGKEISGILPNNKRISEETELILNKREIIKCMKSATVYGVLDDGSKVLLTDSDSINKAVMDKVRERTSSKTILKDDPQPSILDITGTRRMEQKEMKQEVKNSPTNNNYNKGKNKNHNANNSQK